MSVQLSLDGDARLSGLVKSFSFNQSEILLNILRLGGLSCFHLDPCFGYGGFYRDGVPEPELKFDLEPRAGDVVKADVRRLPLPDSSIESVVFDPPFLASSGVDGVIGSRFGCFRDMRCLWAFYRDALMELSRVLEKQGMLVFKCQDIVSGRTQHLSSFEIIFVALQLGFYPKDLFVLLAKNRPLQHNLRVQHHSRKYHSYFLVFQKCRRRAPYSVFEVFDDGL